MINIFKHIYKKEKITNDITYVDVFTYRMIDIIYDKIQLKLGRLYFDNYNKIIENIRYNHTASSINIYFFLHEHILQNEHRLNKLNQLTNIGYDSPVDNMLFFLITEIKSIINLEYVNKYPITHNDQIPNYNIVKTKADSIYIIQYNISFDI